MSVVLKHIGVLLGGLGTTLELSLVAFALAVVLGTVLAVMRVSPIVPLRWFATTYVEVFRNLPLLVALNLFALGLPFAGVTFSLFAAEAVCLGMCSAAFACEAIRGGINAVPVGQAEAARALGMTFTQSLLTVILPQAFRTMVQPLVNVFIGVVLGSSLGAAVGVSELTGRTYQLDMKYAEPLATFLLAAAFYVAVTLSLALLAGRIQKTNGGAQVSATNRVLFDAPGPKARARIRIITVVSVLVMAALLFLGVKDLKDYGQLAAPEWRFFTYWPNVRFLLVGVVQTLKAAAVAGVVALPLGVLLALGRLSENRLVRWAATSYIEVFRSVPLLLVIYVWLLWVPKSGYTFPILWELVLPIVLCNAAVLAEVFRAGVLALDRGQSEAAFALGMRRGQVMRLVVMPQAIRLVVPSLVSQLVSLLKDSTLGYVVSYPELLYQSKTLGSYSHFFLQANIVVAVLFVVINGAVSQCAHALERRARRKPRADGVVPDPEAFRPTPERSVA